MALRDWVPRWWAGKGGAAGVLLDAALLPAELLFRGVASLRNRLYDRGVLRTDHVRVPVVSVGNVTVGGAGKTPVSAWLVRHLADAGHRPALVLRGYGEDEKRVHRELNPDVPVLAAARRIDAARIAAEAGRDVIVLDDAFQHRALHRDLDVVLVAAEGWTERRRLLPRGPWREDVAALARAGLVVVTRKSAPEAEAERVADDLRRLVPGVAVARCVLEPSGLIALHDLPSAGGRRAGSTTFPDASHVTPRRSASSGDVGETVDDDADAASSDAFASTSEVSAMPRDAEPAGNASPLPQNWGRGRGRGPRNPEISADVSSADHATSPRGPADLSVLAGTRVVAVAALATPEPFFDQLRAAGAHVEPAVFPDHHDFGAAEAAALLRQAAGRRIVMTLKDAVKLRPLLSPGAGARVVTQRLRWEENQDALDDALRRALEEGDR